VGCAWGEVWQWLQLHCGREGGWCIGHTHPPGSTAHSADSGQVSTQGLCIQSLQSCVPIPLKVPVGLEKCVPFLAQWAGRPTGRSSSPGGGKNFLFSTSSRPALGSTQPPTQWVPGALSPGVKRLGCEADHSPPTSAEVKKMWIYTSTTPYVSMAQCLIS
jgi:hypothetical protein